MRLSVLGGSSPFILELFLALVRSPLPALREVMLFGRDARALDLVARFARDRLGVAASGTTDLAAACEGFDVIVHQLRYGGMAGRAEDERTALTAGSVPDESLGPAAVSSALRMRDPILEVARQIATGSPDAQLINLTNPLGISTSLLRLGGVRNPIGICELPLLTAAAAAAACGVPLDAMAWEYSGLNHRGFLHGFDADQLAHIATNGSPGAFGGLSGGELRAFGAVPTKYFQLFACGRPISAPGRALVLDALRAAIFAELDADPTRVPPSLARRDQPWWEMSVVPLLHALASSERTRHILDLVGADGLTHEGWCWVSRDGVDWIGSPAPPPAAAAWIDAFVAHEQTALRATLEPSPDNRASASRADPLSPLFSGGALPHRHATGAGE